MDRPSPVHGGCIQQRATGHRGEHPAGCGFLQQGEVCLCLESQAGCLLWRARQHQTVPRQLVHTFANSSKEKDLCYLSSYEGERGISVPESF